MSTNPKSRRDEALRYHSEGRPGKIEVIPTKPYSTQYDLSLAYSPGVAEPCLEIEKNPDEAYKYTAKGNLVAVISNGTAVLGLGDIGALAGKPVMEGKGLLFKTFADIDVFDIEVDEKNVDKFIATVKAISPTFGGINLEDIKAPECFEIEDRLKEELNIPVMHDDQHGTAIISAAALLNALEIVGKKIEDVVVVVNGAGAAAVSCARLYKTLGVRAENMVMCDSRGVISNKRTDLNAAKKEFATDRELSTLAEALAGADVFLGLSVADVLTTEMIRSMADDPIVMALANPNPEISYENAMASRPDIIFATGRSDHPNQVNNVLGFPYIFRGALDVRAAKINEEMKIAAAYALAALAKEPVPEIVMAAYGGEPISFGRDYLIPKPLDPRLLTRISEAVAKAAIESGVARLIIRDWDEYRTALDRRMGRDEAILHRVRTMIQNTPLRRVAFSEGNSINTIRTAVSLVHDKLIIPVLVGDKNVIEKAIIEMQADPESVEVVDFLSDEEAPRRERYAKMLADKLGRRGVSLTEATRYMKQRDWFTLMMEFAGDVDTAIVGYLRRYANALTPVRELFDMRDKTLAAMHIVSINKGQIFFADTMVNATPTAEQLADIALLAADAIKCMGIEPVIAMVSHSNFGSDLEANAAKVARAVEIVSERAPGLLIDGEMKADIALDVRARMEAYPFSKLGDREVNTLIFPNLSSADISSTLMMQLGGFDITGPILLGVRNVNLLSEDSSARSIRKLATIAAAYSSCTLK